MNKKNNPTGTWKGNNPEKNDPTKQDEGDNDATRIRPEKEKGEKPSIPPDPAGTNSKNRSVEEPYKRTPGHKPETVEDPGKEQDNNIHKDYNPATPKNKSNDTKEKDDSGNPVLKHYGRGL